MRVGFLPAKWSQAFEQLAAVGFISPTWRGLISKDQMCEMMNRNPTRGWMIRGPWDKYEICDAAAAAFGVHETAKKRVIPYIESME